MEEESNAYHLHSARIADFILCSQQSFVRFSTMIGCLPAAEDKEAFQLSLKNDSFDRFSYIEEDGELLVGLKNISEEDTKIQALVEWWRCSIAQYLDKVGVPAELGRIASLVERPVDIPRSIRLKDIINSDGAKRFLINGPPDRLMLSKRISQDEIEECKEAWRKRIHDFLYLQPKDITLTTLGSSVARPINLGGSRTKLIELLQTDPQERFHLIYRSPTETVVRVKLTDCQREWIHEMWRNKAANCLLEQKRAMSLTELGASVKRPSIHLGSTSNLRTVLSDDPQDRFIISGQGDNIRVRLSADAEYSPHAHMHMATATSPRSDSFGWSQVSRRTQRPNHAVAGSSAVVTPMSYKPKSRADSSTPHDWATLHVRHHPWDAEYSGGKDGSSSDHSQGSQLHISPDSDLSGPSGLSGLSGLNSFTAESPQSVITSHGSSWDWKGPLEDFALRSILVDAPSITTTTAPSPFNSAQQVAPLIGAPARRPSYKEKLLPPSIASSSVVVEEEIVDRKVIGRPVGKSPPPTLGQTSNKAHTSAQAPAQMQNCGMLSPFASEYRPDAGAPGLVLSPNRSSGDLRDQVKVIEKWLPTVLEGFPNQLIMQLSERLQSEGLLCVKDLVLARSLGQLTPEYLSSLGFKMGHCNRVFAALPPAGGCSV